MPHFIKSTPTITANTPVSEKVLFEIANTPTLELLDKVEENFIRALSDQDRMRIAVHMSLIGYMQGGCPIGGVIIDNDSGLIIGKGHNTLVQENNPLSHGETKTALDANQTSVERFGGRYDFSQGRQFTTLSHCFWLCAPNTVKLGVKETIIGDSTSVDGKPSQDYMRDHGVNVTILEDLRGIGLYGRRFVPNNRALDLEDWLGVAAVKKEGLLAQPRNKYIGISDIFPEIVTPEEDAKLIAESEKFWHDHDGHHCDHC